jgi:phosphohistidine swiveling domain-containing protein
MEAGKISQTEMFARVTAKQYLALHNPSIDPAFKTPPCVTGVAACGAFATGVAVLSSADAIACKEDCILVTKETTPNDFPGMAASVGILTCTGGITSHAAVVARGMDKTCVVGCSDLTIGVSIKAGDQVTIDGATGRVWIGQDVPVIRVQAPKFVESLITKALSSSGVFHSVAPEQAIPGGNSLVDLSGSLTNQTTLAKALKALKKSGASGVITFDPSIEDTHDHDFLQYFDSYSLRDPIEVMDALLQKVCAQSQWTKKFKSQWALQLPSSAHPDTINSLREHGWNLILCMRDWSEVLHINGQITLDPCFSTELRASGVEFSQIAEMVSQTGREVSVLPVAVSRERLLFDVLGG